MKNAKWHLVQDEIFEVKHPFRSPKHGVDCLYTFPIACSESFCILSFKFELFLINVTIKRWDVTLQLYFGNARDTYTKRQATLALMHGHTYI